MIPDGNTLVMGGLVNDNPTASYTKVPVLGDIPGLGWAFRSETKATTKDNLIIFHDAHDHQEHRFPTGFEPPLPISSNPSQR